MKLWKAALFVFCLNISQNSIAAIGTVTETAATPASIKRQSSTLTGSKGTGVEMNDLIQTTQGKAGITFNDDTKVQVNENSKLVIDEFVYDPKAKGGKLGVKVALGTVRYASGQIAKNNPQNVAVNTPTATIAVRGTDFTMTVDEVGASTIILLPSCPKNWVDVERDCKTGKIEVITDAGKVIMDQPFQATKTTTRGILPLKPVVVNLTEDAINNLLIVSPPKELRREIAEQRKNTEHKNVLDINFLEENHLVDNLVEVKEFASNKLDRNFLDNDFLANVLDIIDAQMAAQLNLLNTSKSGLLPDYVATSGVVAEVDDLQVILSKDNGSDRMSVAVPKNQNSTIYMTQGSVEIKNRVNTGGTTTITLIQK